MGTCEWSERCKQLYKHNFTEGEVIMGKTKIQLKRYSYSYSYESYSYEYEYNTQTATTTVTDLRESNSPFLCAVT